MSSQPVMVRSGRRDCEKPPLAGDALQYVRPPIFELDPGSEREVLDRRRGEDLAGPSEGYDTGSDVHCQPTDVVADQLDLACM